MISWDLKLLDQLEKLRTIQSNARIVLTNLLVHNRLSISDIPRVLDGHYLYYVEFSSHWRTHTHPKLANAHPDGYVVIEGAKDAAEAQHVANKVLGRSHRKPIFEGVYDFPFKSRGEILRIQAADHRGE